MNQLSKSTEKSLFEIYSKNLSFIQHEPIDVFICTLCLEKFYRSDIEGSDDNAPLITIEHVRPKALGGKPITLTCKKCNNFAGRELDSDLLNSLLLRDFLEGKSGSSVDSVIDVDGKKIRAKLETDKKSSYRLSYPGNRNNPKDLTEFRKSLQKSMNIGFMGEYQKKVRVNRPDWSLLRIAYLWLFSVFGYGSIMRNPNMEIVREQINNPEKEVLKYWGYESNINISDDYLGINIVEAPRELRSFMIVFDLITPTSKRRHGVLLPGPSNPGISIYQTQVSVPERKSELIVRNIPVNREYLTNRELCMTSTTYWNNPI